MNSWLLSRQKIWDYAEHNALTDLIFFKARWFCVFRESTKHVYGTNGAIRVISSQDGIEWASAAYFQEDGIDLRDPKFCITPEGELMLLAGGTKYRNKKYIYRQPRVAFSQDGYNWSAFQLVLEPHEWLWRVTWHQGIAYGVSYRYSEPKNRNAEWLIKLYKSSDGIHYDLIVQWDIQGKPNETTLRFLENDQMVALVRRDGKDDNVAWIGSSFPPYIKWIWKAGLCYFGGPNFIILPNQQKIAAGRILLMTPYGLFPKTVLAYMDTYGIVPFLTLPSAGDCSYPGLAWHNDLLWVSYYSSDEEKTAIYLAKVKLSSL